MTSTTTRARPVPADEQERLRSLDDHGAIGAPHCRTCRRARRRRPASPPRTAPRVLEMFTRRRTDVEGSGIGPATCQRLVEAHDATLVIDQTSGGGTTMPITLPRP